MREIEAKLKVSNMKDLEEKLKEGGCVLSAPIHQHDIIYSREGSDSEWAASKEGDIILRIRRENGKAIFNLKQQRSSELDNIEYETVVEDFEAMDSILKTLNWQPFIEVEKNRRKGKWKEYEICLDQVGGLGDYVELEKMSPENADPGEVLNELLGEMEKLGIDRANLEEKGYDTMLYFLKGKIK